jgi:hypothetical protein
MHGIFLAASTKQLDSTSNFQLWGVPIIVGVIFYILGAITTVYIKRPKLAVLGMSSGGSALPTGFITVSITVGNASGRVGVRIGQTVLFGLRINNPHWFGLPVMREPATECMASLCDKKGSHIAPLWWRDPKDALRRKPLINLDSGQQAELFLFAQRNDEVPRYYIYEQDSNAEPKTSAVALTETMRFIVRLSWANGQKKRDLKYTVTTGYTDGRIVVWAKWRTHPHRRW